MIDQVDERIGAWVTQILPGVVVSFDVPAPDRHGIAITLLDLLPNLPARGNGRPPIQFVARYLVTAGGDVAAAHRALGNLLVAALEAGEFEPELAPIAPEIWTAFGVPPQPAFLLRALVQVERPMPVAPLVRQPLVVEVTTEGR